MWNRAQDVDENRIERMDTFWEKLRDSHRSSVMVEMLNTQFRPIEGGTIFSSDKDNNVSNFISDGNIDVDRSRAIRRTAELTLLNPTSEFTPATEEFDSEGPWVGKIYVNRMVRIWRGLYVEGQAYYVPVGTFMVDVADVVFEQNMSLVHLTMSDRWKMAAKSFFGSKREYDKNTLYNTIIKDLLSASGIPLSGSHGAVIDGLGTRPSDDRRTNGKIIFKTGDSRGDKLKELCDKWNIDAYFDPMGTFRTEDRRRHTDKQVVWRFFSSQRQDGMLLSIRRSFNDDNLYNNVIIVGTGDEKKTVVAKRRNDNPDSKTSVAKLGNRVYLKESTRISTPAEAKRALDRAWNLRHQLSETLEIQTICHPALEADDMIHVKELDFVKVSDKYRITRFNIPLVTNRQTIQMTNIIKRGDYL
jgi:hypothetical protein